MTALAFRTPRATVAELLRRARRDLFRHKHAARQAARRDHNAAIADCQRQIARCCMGFGWHAGQEL